MHLFPYIRQVCLSMQSTDTLFKSMRIHHHQRLRFRYCLGSHPFCHPIYLLIYYHCFIILAIAPPHRFSPLDFQVAPKLLAAVELLIMVLIELVSFPVEKLK